MRIVLGNFKVDCLVEEEEKKFIMEVPEVEVSKKPKNKQNPCNGMTYDSKILIDKNSDNLHSLYTNMENYEDFIFKLSNGKINRIDACDKTRRSYPFLKEFLNWIPGDLGAAFEYLRTYGIRWSHKDYFTMEYLYFERVHMCFEFSYQLIRMLRGKKYIKEDGDKEKHVIGEDDMDDRKLFVMLLNFFSWNNFPFLKEFADLSVYENMGRLVIFHMANGGQVDIVSYGEEKTRESYNGDRWHDHLLGYADLNLSIYTFKTQLEQISIKEINSDNDIIQDVLFNDDANGDNREKTELEYILEENEAEDFFENMEERVELTEDESRRIYNDEKERKRYVIRRAYELLESGYDNGYKNDIHFLDDKEKKGYIERITLIIDFLEIVKYHYEYIQSNDQQSFEEILYGKKVAVKMRSKSVAIDVDEKISFTSDEQKILREVGKILFQDIFERLASYYPLKMSIEISMEDDNIAKRIAYDEPGTCYEIVPFTDNTLGALIHAFIYTVEDERFFRKCRWCGKYFTPPVKRPNSQCCCSSPCSDMYGKAKKREQYGSVRRKENDQKS